MICEIADFIVRAMVICFYITGIVVGKKEIKQIRKEEHR